LEGVSLEIRTGEFFSLLGASGCGKTTLLRIIAGLDHPDSGTLLLHGEDALARPAHERPVNTVFQSYALFPHLSVRENIAFGLRMKRVPPAEATRRVAAVLDLCELGSLADRRPHQLSGGQKQRVALARAVVNEPRVLLLDEPLAALDLQLRRQLRTGLHTLQRRLGITFVLVTHDQEEALSLSDRVAVMRAGRIEQVGTGEALYHHPASRFVAGFLGDCNWLPVRVTGPDTFESPLGVWRAAAVPSGVPEAWAAFRPESVTQATPGALNGFEARLVRRTFTGAATECEFERGELRFKMTALTGTAGLSALSEGITARLAVPPEALTVLRA
ncbi:MAG: ABC transporter ATP-binding protein, partial [Verrucomicrobia bacterium]|nr:ABC transporter ATP-binding protein [Verrucomicrobiota bacterium]